MAGLRVFFLLRFVFVCLWVALCASGFRTSTLEPRGKPEKQVNYNLDVWCLENLPVEIAKEPDRTFTPDDEIEVLENVYHKTGGDNWTNRTGWLNRNISHCSWYGVTCDNKTSYVISLDLKRNNLINRLPNLWKLRNLISICAPLNGKLYGSIADVVAPNMTRLKRIDLAFSSFSGVIPEFISSMTSLVKIQVCCQRGVGLSGSIPHDIGNLSELQVLSIGENAIEGQIPSSIGRLKKLWFLDLETLSRLRGEVQLFSNLSALQFMHLSSAGITGTLPEGFGLFYPNMNQCLLAHNSLHGTIPSSIGAMKNMTQLDFSRNNFTGFQNGTTFETSQIEILILSENKHFSADFSHFVLSIMQLNTTLRIFNAESCNFTGSIPAELWTFTNLILVDVSNNKLSGEIPDIYDDMIFLLKLDFSKNNLTGPIPESFTQLKALQNMDISGNQRMSRPSNMKTALQNFLRPDLELLVRKDPHQNFTCPYIRLSYNDGLVVLDPEYYHHVFCTCDVGYYGYRGRCVRCMDGGSCMEERSGPVFPSRMTLNQGYWPSPSPHNASLLVRCNPLQQQTHFACNPSGACMCSLEITSTAGTGSGFHTRCDGACVCEAGSLDRFCSRCLTGYYRDGNICRQCPRYSISIDIFIVILVATLVVLWWAFVYVKRRRKLAFVVALGQVTALGSLWCFELIPGWVFEVNTLVLIFYIGGRGTCTRGLLKITIFYLQIVDAMISGYNSWPSQITNAHHYISSVINFHFPGMACQFPLLFTPVGKLSSVLLFPIFGLCIIWSYYGVVSAVNYLRGNGQERLISLKWQCRQISIVTLNLLYFPVVKQTISMLSPCATDGRVAYMRAAQWVECRADNSTYVTLRATAGCALLYVVGIPVFIFLPLLRRYSKQVDQLDEIQRKGMDSWLGSIYLPYKESVRHYFESLVLMRKFLLAFFIAILPSTSAFQTLALMITLSAAIIVQLVLQPYEDSLVKFPLENACETMVLFTLLHSLAVIRFAVCRDEENGALLLWIITGVNMLVIVLLIVAVVLVFVKGQRQAVEEEEYEQIQGEG